MVPKATCRAILFTFLVKFEKNVLYLKATFGEGRADFPVFRGKAAFKKSLEKTSGRML